jgi:cell shape-determining protein MreD
MATSRINEARRSAILRRIVIYSPIFFILGVAQCSFFTELSFISTVPNIVLGAIVAISLLDSEYAALICALASGFMIDALGSSGISLSPISFLVIALVASEISKKILPTFVSYLMVLIPSTLINAIFTIIKIFFATKELRFLSIFKTILLPEFILTVIFSLPLFFIIRPFKRIVDKKSKFKV